MSLAFGDPLSDDDFTAMKSIVSRPLSDYLTGGQITDAEDDLAAWSPGGATYASTALDNTVTPHITDINAALDATIDPVIIAYAVEWQLNQANAVDPG